MSNFFKRYRRQSIVKALKGPDLVFQLDESDIMADLAFGR